jgi:hypothetical protein
MRLRSVRSGPMRLSGQVGVAVSGGAAALEPGGQISGSGDKGRLARTSAGLEGGHPPARGLRRTASGCRIAVDRSGQFPPLAGRQAVGPGVGCRRGPLRPDSPHTWPAACGAGLCVHGGLGPTCHCRACRRERTPTADCIAGHRRGGACRGLVRRGRPAARTARRPRAHGRGTARRAPGAVRLGRPCARPERPPCAGRRPPARHDRCPRPGRGDRRHRAHGRLCLRVRRGRSIGPGPAPLPGPAAGERAAAVGTPRWQPPLLPAAIGPRSVPRRGPPVHA